MSFADNHNFWKEKDLLSLTSKYGTPIYVYDSSKIVSQYQLLKKAFQNTNCKINYACKALTNINILKILKNEGSGLDTVSIQEVEIGLQAGFKPEDIIFTPNCVSFREICKAVEYGVTINIDNISTLEQFGAKYGSSVPISIRFNPHIMAGGNYNISTGHIDSKFGISIYQVRHVERVIASTNLKIIGLHMHTGSEIKDIEVFLRSVDILFDLTSYFTDLEFLVLGSGFKIPYYFSDVETPILELGEKLSKKFNEFCLENNKKLELWLEPGKFLVSEAGVLIAKANVIKQTTATVFVGINSGFNHLIRPMLYQSYHYIENLSNLDGIDRIYTVVGYICETDIMGWDRTLKEVQEGDILCIYNAGAYGFEMASNYNSRLKPAEILLHNNQDYLIRKRENLDDLLRNQMEIIL